MIDKLQEKLMVEAFEKLDEVPFTLSIGNNDYQIGKGEPEFHVHLDHPIPVGELANSTSLALGEHYMDGNLTIDGDLYEVLCKFLKQMNRFTVKDEGMIHKLLKTSLSKTTQSKQVRSHYDIGNDFYKLWLDKTMCYSCAYFKNADDDLYTAQMNKLHHLLDKLYLQPGQRLLDIGCGWGGLLIEAAKKYGIKGVGITLSEEQYAECQRRFKAEGLEGQLEVRLMDYRDLPSSGLKFDRVVSVGMFEHVGRENYQLFNDCVRDVLVDGGLYLLHTITCINEGKGDPWIHKYIFPGGCIPTVREILGAMANDGFFVHDVENLRIHYNKTLLHWRKNFHEQLPAVHKMFDDRFIRMWDLYLASCAASFYIGGNEIHQILVTKGVNNDLPLTRWY